MIPTIERILFLNKISLFDTFSVDELWQVAQAVNEMRFVPGETLFEEGKPGRAVYLVVSGEVVCSISGKEFARIGKDTVLGDVAVLDGMPFSMTATAVDDVLTIKVEREKLYDILKASPDAALGIISDLCKKVRFLLEQQFKPASDESIGSQQNIPLLKM